MLDLKITTLIVEKDRKSLATTVSILKQFDELSIIGKTISGKQGFALENTFVPQIIFINVELSDMSGLGFVHTLRNRNQTPEIIFLSNSNRYAFESLILQPFDYFVLPLEKTLISGMITRFKQSLKRKELLRRMDVYAQTNEATTKRIFFQKKGIIVLKLKEIIFARAKLSKTDIMTRNGEHFLLKSTLNETLEIINNKDFVHISRSYFINKNYLRKIEKRSIKVVLYYNGITWEVPVSKSTIGTLEKLNVQPIY